MFDTPAFVNGLALGFGIFICPGPKDVLILRQALLGRSAFALVALGCISDALLIWLGIAGLSAAMVAAPVLQSAALWFGACLLAGHGLFAARSAILGGETGGAFSDANKEISETKSVVAWSCPMTWCKSTARTG